MGTITRRISLIIGTDHDDHTPILVTRPQVPLWINGSPTLTVEVRDITDPARPSLIVGQMSSAGGEDVERALTTAVAASSPWADVLPEQRATLLRAALSEVIADVDFVKECARLLTRETGKILHESEVDLKVFQIRWSLALGLSKHVGNIETLEPLTGSPVRTEVHSLPLGVVGIILPYNWPLAILAASLPTALLAGNAVIVKPPATAPLATSLWVSRIAQALPPGVLSVLAGSDAQMESLVTDNRVAKVCFTGSVITGKRLMELSAPRVGRLLLELGGNDAAIVCEDAPLDDAHLDMMFHAVFDTSGQICMNIKRIYVHTARAEELISGFESRMHKMVLGHGLQSEVSHGPVHTQEHAQRLTELLDEARKLGAEIRSFGTLPPALPGELQGHFVLPTLVINPPETSRIVVEEQFGPIIPIMTFTADEEALASANNSWAGLGGSVWSGDITKARTIAARMEAGYVWVNDHGAPRLDLRAPFGGWSQSGFGREQGPLGVREFVDTRTIAVTEIKPRE